MARATASSTAITRSDVATAARELAKMRASLRSWLYYRTLNDRVAEGKSPSKLGQQAAAEIIRSQRDWQAEQKIASLLYALLQKVNQGGSLPSPDVAQNPDAAVSLARIALTGQASTQVSGPTATAGIFSGAPPWLWPVLIVGGVLLGVTTAIKSYTDLARDREKYACIKAGACTDYGFYLKWAAIIGGAWFAWEKVGIGSKVKELVGGIGRKHT